MKARKKAKRIDAGEREANALHNLSLAISLVETVTLAAEKLASDKDFGSIYYALQLACTKLHAAHGEVEREMDNG